MSNKKRVHVVIFGIGNVGSTLINQIRETKNELNVRQELDIRIPIITNSKLALFNIDGLSNTWETDFKTTSFPYNINSIVEFVKKEKFENLIAIDATASKEFVANYELLIKNGFHIVSANKVANTLDYNFYSALRSTLKEYDKSFLYETNVGAGLPIIETVKSLHDSGEKIHKIRGVFSGSLSYIFNTFSESELSFTKVLNEASKLGLTEPDAREDLSGTDVARKLLILARELNLKAELNDVEIQSLVPKYLNGKTTLHHFNVRKKELNKPFQELKDATNSQEVLRYIAELDVVSNTLEVKLIPEAKNSTLGQLKGADSAFEIYTESYGENPLVILGAGAGRDVTARGVLSDIVKLSSGLN